MNFNELNVTDGFNLPRLTRFKEQASQSYYQKSDYNAKYDSSTDLRLNFLTRYNKKFWQGVQSENRNLSLNKTKLRRPEGDGRFNSQQIKKVPKLNLIETNDFDDKMRYEIENIDRWVFNNLKRMTLPQTSHKDKGRGDRVHLSVDMQMLNFILQGANPLEGVQGTVQSNNSSLKNGSISTAMHNSIAATSEMLSNDHNKTLVVDILKRKLTAHSEYRKKDESYDLMLAKSIASDLIASFKTLVVFKHQDVLRLREILALISNEMQSTRESMMIAETSDTAEDHVFYEKTLKKKLTECEEEISSKKEVIKTLLDKIRDKNTALNTEKQKMYNFNRLLDEKESQATKTRKIGEKMKLKEFMEISELKQRKEQIEAAISQISKICSKDVTDLNLTVDQITRQVEELKFRKTWFVFKLKEFYLNFLQNENELIKLNRSLLPIIRNVWSLDEDVLVSSFSKFYDKEDVAFILKYAKAHVEFLAARAENKVKKEDVRDTVSNNFNTILNEDQFEIISGFKENMKRLKTNELKLFELRKVSTSKNSFVYKYCEVLKESGYDNYQDMGGMKTRVRFDVGKFSSQLSQLSERLSQIKEQYIRSIVKRVVDKNNRNRLLGPADSEYLNKMLRLVFGYHEMQVIVKRLVKESQIQIIPI